jgi:hypothetical protein
MFSLGALIVLVLGVILLYRNLLDACSTGMWKSNFALYAGLAMVAYGIFVLNSPRYLI